MPQAMPANFVILIKMKAATTTYIVRSICRVLLACATGLFASTKVAAREGLFPLDKAPADALHAFGPAVSNAARAVGRFALAHTKKVEASKVSTYIDLYCKNDSFWNREICEQLTSSQCSDGCLVEFDTGCSGVAIVGGHFITAGHCRHEEKENGPAIWAKFLNERRELVRVALEETAATRHDLPYDLAVYRIVDPKFHVVGVPLRLDDPADDEPVFGIGFPYLAGRKNYNGNYEFVYGGMRITLGEVANANRGHGSYCSFSNDVDDVEAAHPENWTLDQHCNGIDYSQFIYEAREERDPFLTNTDMIYGMSGSPLFDANGQLLGIGTTILNSSPGDYDPNKNAVYVKSTSLAKVLAKLHPSIASLPTRPLTPGRISRSTPLLQRAHLQVAGLEGANLFE